MAVSALDSRVFRNLFGTQEVRDIFTDDAYAGFLIEVEAALARAETTVGVIPAAAGQVITDAFAKITLDFDRLARETDIVGYPVLPLVKQLVEGTPGEIAKYIHWGATTQDIMDDASMLQMKKGLQLVRRELQALAEILKGLAVKYRDTPMAGRTHLQHALPCTFGYKCAVYLSSILRHQERLDEIERRCLLAQFGGAAGTLASLQDADTGLQVRAELAKELGLKEPLITWHVARTLGKVALDLMVMSSNEYDEVSEPFVPHRAASKLLRSNASLGLDAMVTDFERASGPWHLEWVAIPEAFIVAVGALNQSNFALGGLVVKVDSMSRNLHSTRGLIVGEAVMMGLAPVLGRQKAHDVVYEACKIAIEENRSLLEVLKENADLSGSLPVDRLANLCDPLQYLGASQQMIIDC
ncbi:hypothetical protein BDV12DRAFT_185918 [Aspergillus spectabilis]